MMVPSFQRVVDWPGQSLSSGANECLCFVLGSMRLHSLSTRTFTQLYTIYESKPSIFRKQTPSMCQSTTIMHQKQARKMGSHCEMIDDAARCHFCVPKKHKDMNTESFNIFIKSKFKLNGQKNIITRRHHKMTMEESGRIQHYLRQQQPAIASIYNKNKIHLFF
jgi:hypothetical protein